MINLDLLSNEEFQNYVFLQNCEFHLDEVNWYKGSAFGILGRCIYLFENAACLSDKFSRQEILEGFDFISGSRGFFYYPADPSVEWSLREGFYLAMIPLFRDVFANDALDSVSFNWFERILVWSVDREGRVTAKEPRLRKAMLETERGVLALESRNCREAALHGLNHLHHEEPSACEQVIDEFLLAHPTVEPDIAQYARQCRAGGQL